ncbi:cytochrome d ubiquinol oxidase subunit II [Evansella cellulosilytica]|uniref:Cytochrome d ubiquinol oxidase subunit II n=1 Tax=Evansella cellulosilytica (strain ATCC 21833 / DSM 2522 / FERM P-1141 / JCM 9156 / N-4) TaxID=649639 RepID=E6TRA3_EVAC2|nr:cytochrome d ubiquinol oxidase subunit II [Evansella cellulosilytica]ADU30615.1 cytochrome d ubiquinol oxidase subunit II [Evansella cellulosilytica DSM 2522]
MIELIGITVLWIFLFGYLIIGSIDFGAGFYSFYAKITNKKHSIRQIIDRYLSPVWEVTNVFLVFFMIGLIGFFPDSAYYYGTALLVPGSVALVLLAIRGSFYAFANYGARESNIYLFLYGITGLLIPAALSTVLTISEGGFIVRTSGDVHLLLLELFVNPYSWIVVMLAIVSVLFISATFLTYYANKAKDKDALLLMRRFSMIWSGPTILLSFLVFLTLSTHNEAHFQAMLDESWIFLLSLVSFVLALWFIYKQKYLGLAFTFVCLQFGFAFFGYGYTHLPYILYPYITIFDNVTSPEMGITLIMAFIAGLFLLLPSLYLLLRLFLFNAEYVQGK